MVVNEENGTQTVTVKEISTTWDHLRAEVGRSPENGWRGGNSKSGTFWLFEGIRVLEIPAPYYGDRLRRQFPPSSRPLNAHLT